MNKLSRYTLITGASSGIGLHTARLFSARGDRLALIARRYDRLKNIKSELETKYNNSIEIYECDLSNSTQVDQLFSECGRTLCEVDVLVNNAGLAKGWAPFYQSQIDDWNKVLDTNIQGTFQMIRHIAPRMRERGNGHIINLGSVAGRWTYPNDAVYCASKFAIRTMTESLRIELEGTGVRVSVIEPGPVNTELIEVRHGSKISFEELWRNFEPLQPEDIAEAIDWVADQPKYMNVQEMVIYPTAQASIFMSGRGN